MSSHHPDRQPPPGSIGYLQLPTTDLRASIAFYDAVLGWRGEEDVRQLRGARR